VESAVVFVTGANGFVGSHLVRELLSKGHKVRALIRPQSDRSRVNDLPIEWVTGDLDDANALAEGCAGARWVIHSAARVKAPDLEAYRHANATGTANLLDAALQASAQIERFVFVSSMAAGGPATAGWPRVESDPDDPQTPYGISKLEGEMLVRAHADRLPVSIVRAPAVYGPGDTEVLGFFQAVDWHLKPIFSRCPSRLSIVHVADLVEGILRVAGSPAAAGETFYIAESEQYDMATMEDLIQASLDTWAVRVRIPKPLLMGIATVCEWVGKAGGFTPKLNRNKARDFLQTDWTCSVEKAETILDFRAKIPFARGARQTVEWYRAKGWL
jgi:nucleoside-diphosphate-sugar epimerase